MLNNNIEILFFNCERCGYPLADLVGIQKLEYPSEIKIVKVPCTGKVDVIHILKAFENNIDGVAVIGCLEGECHYLNGNFRAKKKIEWVKKLLEELKIENERVEFLNVSAEMSDKFVKFANEFTERIKKLGKVKK